MHSSQYIALARYLDNEGLEVRALHFLPGAMQDADGIYVVAYDGLRDQGGNVRSYTVLSLHVSSQPVQAAEFEVTDLMCGDRAWHDHAEAMEDFAMRVRMDSDDLNL